MPISVPVPSNRKPCPMCGEMIAAAAVKCRFCGEIVDAHVKRTSASGTPKNLGCLWTLGCAFLFASFGAIIGGSVFQSLMYVVVGMLLLPPVWNSFVAKYPMFRRTGRHILWIPFLLSGIFINQRQRVSRQTEEVVPTNEEDRNTIDKPAESQPEAIGLADSAIHAEPPATPQLDVIGTWIDRSPGAGSRITITSTNGKLLLERQFNDGSHQRKELFETKASKGRRFDPISVSRSGDHWIVNDRGQLEIRDSVGLIVTVSP